MTLFGLIRKLEKLSRSIVTQLRYRRNLGGFCRSIVMQLRYRNLHAGLFYLGRGSQIDVGPNANIHFGRSVNFTRDFSGVFYGNVTFGDRVWFNRGCYVSVHGGLSIGDYSMFGEGVSIHDENHVIGSSSEPLPLRGFVVKPITIGKNVWVGAKATILQGVHIGDNAVIGANAVVTHDIPANTIVGGIPARIIRELRVAEQSFPEWNTPPVIRP